MPSIQFQALEMQQVGSKIVQIFVLTELTSYLGEKDNNFCKAEKKARDTKTSGISGLTF